MSESLHRTAGGYRDRAEELRVIAGDSRQPDLKLKLLGIADDYDRMAVVLDRMTEQRKLIG